MYRLARCLSELWPCELRAQKIADLSVQSVEVPYVTLPNCKQAPTHCTELRNIRFVSTPVSLKLRSPIFRL
jgi:hypothetical protein